jgi:uncharacterized protein (DUF2235 family)
MANVIVCCDGTWNTAEDRDGGVPCPTNVVKINNAIADVDGAGARQPKYYHPGVGTDGTLLAKLKGGALGDGLEKNIKSAYKWLAQNYHPGDAIFIFGFSRGAYTARYVAGMISGYGLADFVSQTVDDDVMWRLLDRVFDAARDDADPLTLAGENFFNTPAGASPRETTPVHFLGVWDTVGALGVPSDIAFLSLLDNWRSFQFKDTVLSRNVRHARHAVAMDEQRESFTPTLWANAKDHPDAKQIWFAGVHSDVGGGYAQTGLSDIALEWMMDEAEKQGLAFRAGIRQQLAPDPKGTLHESCTGVFSALRTLPRAAPRVAPGAPALHASVLERYADPPIAQTPFWPTLDLGPGGSTAVDIYAAKRWNRTGLWLEKGAAYQFIATGQWIDDKIKTDPSGATDGAFQFGRIAQKAASWLGEAEQLYKDATGDKQADFWWTKRIEEYEWFALVGVIANGRGTDEKGDPAPHETFLIGNGLPSYVPQESGYLYCFANDAWATYANNNGSVRLTVKRP